jgi:hypothetical protein
MSERLNKCPNCGALQYSDFIVKVHNPDTTDMNMNATLSCGGMAPDVVWKGKVVQPAHDVEGCGHEWEGLVMSNHHRRGRERGEYI